MSVVERPEPLIIEEPRQPRRINPLKWLREEGQYLWRGLTAYPLFALLFGALALLTLAYQVPLDFQFKTGPDFTADYLYAASFNRPESNGQFGFRWSTEESYLRFPGVGRLTHATLDITMQVGGRPPNLPFPQVEIWAGGRKIGEATVGPGAKVYRFDYRPEGGKLDGNLIFTLKVPSAFQDKNHNLPLGVVVTEAHLYGGPEGNRPVIPALPHLAVLLAGLVIFYLALVRAGWSTMGAARWAGLLAVGATLAVAFVRLHLTPALESLFLSMLIAYPLMALGLRVTNYWLREFRVQSSGFRVEESRVENSSFIIQRSSLFTRWLGLIFFAAFVVKAAGLDHPAFLPIDHWFRLHQILRFWDSPAAFWQQYFNVSTGQTVTGLQGGSAVLGQWGLSFSLPYSPLFYLLAAPFALIWPTHDPNLFAAVNLLATWLEASSIFLIYIIAREAYRGTWAARAGLIAGALYGFYPLSFLLFSDGGYNSILAHWLTLLFVALLFKGFNLWAEGKKSRWLNLWLILTLGAALLAHTSTLLLLGSLVIVFPLILTLTNRFTRKTTKTSFATSSFILRPSSFILQILGGFGLAFVLYYGWYMVPFVRDSLPALLGKLGNGGIGQDRKLLGTDLLTGFWPQLWQHFRLFPFILTIGFIVSIFWKGFRVPGSKSRVSEESEGNYPQSSVRPSPNGGSPQFLFFVSWLVVFLGFSLLDLKVNLLQKHMLFAAPLLCLGSGFALSLLWEWTGSLKTRASVARLGIGLLTGGLIVFMVWQGLALWYARVFYYTLPPGSG